jgi:hypothetical protein
MCSWGSWDWRPDGLNPAGHSYAHPENHSPATIARLVDSLRQAAATAETEGITLPAHCTMDCA